MPKSSINSRAPSVRVHPYESDDGLFYPGAPPPNSVDELDTADSRTRPLTCEQWKQRFDDFLDAHVTGIYNKYNQQPERKRRFVDTHPKRDSILEDVVQQSGFEQRLSNQLQSVFAQQDDEACLEYILKDRYVQIFRPAYDEFMSYPNSASLNSRCYNISLAIMLRALKDKLYGEFSFGKSNSLILFYLL